MSIVATATEIKVNGIPVSSVEGLNIERVGLYYEPEVGNSFKTVQSGDDVYRVELTDAEVAECQRYLASWTPPAPEEQPPVVEEEPKDETVIYVIDEAGSASTKPRFAKHETDVEITEAQFQTRLVHSWDHPQQRWNASAGAFEGVSAVDKRIIAYLKAYSFGDQLDIMWKAVAAIRDSGVAMPAEVNTLLADFAQIKQDNPL